MVRFDCASMICFIFLLCSVFDLFVHLFLMLLFCMIFLFFHGLLFAVRSVMITGDNLLTAVYVAKSALISKGESVRLLEMDEDRNLVSSVITGQGYSIMLSFLFILSDTCFSDNCFSVSHLLSQHFWPFHSVLERSDGELGLF